MFKLTRLLTAIAIGIGWPLVAQVQAQEQARRGIEGIKAPTWNVGEWVQFPEGKTSLDVADFKGKVVYLGDLCAEVVRLRGGLKIGNSVTTNATSMRVSVRAPPSLRR
jgi:hypothetical protein